MKRRDFIKKSAVVAAATSFMVNGLPIKALGQNHFLTKSLNGAFDDRILVLIQLHGGNDGINTLVPIEQYGTYQSYRPNIAISDTGARKFINLDSTLSTPDQIGLHPDMTNFKSMYEDAMVNIVQGVGYENTNGSHFRSRDIWFMGGDYDEYKKSGWMGRYLNHEFPNYPDAYPNAQMPDPLGLEIGSKVSLGYHREVGIPTALAIQDPSNINSIVSFLGGINPSNLSTDHYSQELQHIIDIYSNTSDYAQNIQDRYDAGNNNVTYPGNGVMNYPFEAPTAFLQNSLGPQLETVARLIQGGSKTKIYLVKLNGFDTHNAQVGTTNPSYGIHGALLYHLSNAVKAFFDDLAVSGKDENVMAMTFTDFGRRPDSNGSNGTDHGTASPTFVFGKSVQAGVIGTNPSLSNLDASGNLLIQNDYRQIITSILCDWMGADMDSLTATELEAFAGQKLNIVDTSTGLNDADSDAYIAVNVFPNPVSSQLNITYQTKHAGNISIAITDVGGKEVYKGENQVIIGGNSFSLDLSSFSSGVYVISVRDQETNKVVGKQFTKK